jgi:ribosome biogenesis GTPase / thiamine phosphate phosphatase
MMQGVVYKSTGSWYKVKCNDTIFNARIKGVLKIDGFTSTNPIAVGDVVDMEMENDVEQTTTITNILPRKNYVARVSPHNKHQHHIIASNLDQSILFATLKSPKTSQGFIDRFLVACEMHHIPAVIVFNKADLHGKKEDEQFEILKTMYQQIGYKVLLTSVVENRGLDDLKMILQHKTSLLSGHSGTGKSSCINALFPHLQLRTSEVSEWSGKGLHTTTFAEMHQLNANSTIIDTPGIRELGLVDIEKEELSGYFPEMKRHLQDCKFNNCMHLNEPSCAVKQAIGNGLIDFDRYQSYYNILETITKEW